ncbi:unnamed protein product, partial [Mesorhabditis belari]|uniref:Uncharacterized protein n=1 Tax=Mesorhabditis belari TaxID=2138241 RepID=A0AAF3EY69_9BILA
MTMILRRNAFLWVSILWLLGCAQNLNADESVGQTKPITMNPTILRLLEKVNSTFIRPFIGNGTLIEIVEGYLPDSVGSIPSFRSTDSANQAAAVAASPFLNTLTNFLPSLRKLPGLNRGQFRGASGVSANSELNAAVDQFTAPLVRTATKNGQLSPVDLEQLLNSIPNLLVNLPGFGKEFDINELDPKFIKSLLSGQGILGLPRETTDPFVKLFTDRMVDAAQSALEGRSTPEKEKYLPRLDKIPEDMIGTVLGGGNLPGLSAEQTRIVKEYYMEKGFAPKHQANEPEVNVFKQMRELLPPDYNISRLSREVMQMVMNGDMPEIQMLPADVQVYLKDNFERVLEVFSKIKGNASIDGLIKKMPNFERPALRTFDPYDLNGVNHELRLKEADEEKARKVRLYSAIVLGGVAIVTIIVLAFLYVHAKNRIPNHTSCHPGSPPSKKDNILLSSTKIHPHVQ